jgi:hypothetical protein
MTVRGSMVVMGVFRRHGRCGGTQLQKERSSAGRHEAHWNICSQQQQRQQGAG